jgi:hypothetical protein
MRRAFDVWKEGVRRQVEWIRQGVNKARRMFLRNINEKRPRIGLGVAFKRWKTSMKRKNLLNCENKSHDDYKVIF